MSLRMHGCAVSCHWQGVKGENSATATCCSDTVRFSLRVPLVPTIDVVPVRHQMRRKMAAKDPRKSDIDFIFSQLSTLGLDRNNSNHMEAVHLSLYTMKGC